MGRGSIMKAGLLILLALLTAAPSWGAESKRLIVVSATAEKAVKPDLLSFYLEIWAQTPAAQRTQTLAADEAKRVRGILENYKIAKEDIQTESFQFGPEYVWDQSTNKNRLNGFSSRQTLKVVLRKVDQAGRLIDALTVAEKGSAGPRPEFGTNINRIQWESSERAEGESEVLAEAVKAARAKANAMAKAAGVKVRQVHRLSHLAMVEPGPRPMLAKVSMMAGEASSTELTPGEIKLQVTVTAEYEIQ